MNASAAEQTETTPLLNGSTRNVQPPASGRDRPQISTYIGLLRSQGLPSDDDWLPRGLPPGPDRAAFELTVLLIYKASLHGAHHSNEDVWEQWSEEAKHAASIAELEARILATWEAFLNVPRSCSEIERVLWNEHLLSECSAKSIRVIDLYEQLPPGVLCHRVVELSLLRTWRYNTRGDTSSMNTWGQLARSLYAPRVLHFLDLLGLLAYMAILTRYVLDPPTVTVETTTGLARTRAASLVAYSLFRVLHHRSSMQIPYLITALAFLFSLPSTPLPSDTTYSALLIALSLHVLQLHLPCTPSPVYLLPFHQVLPLSLLIWNSIAKIYLPVLALFLPTLVLVLALLSLSLMDPIITMAGLGLASPLEARTAFLLLLLILLLLLMFSVGMLILVYPSISTSGTGTSPWDRYSRALGLEARRSLIFVVLSYAIPHSSASGVTRGDVFPPNSSSRWRVLLHGLPPIISSALVWILVAVFPALLVGILAWDLIS